MESVFLNALNGKKGDRPAVWYMRQAGRVIPEYNKLREKYTFHQLISDPSLAADVTLMPITKIGVDAAIIFNDILSLPIAMGMKLDWTEKGPRFSTPLTEIKQPHLTLHPDIHKLENVFNTVDIIKKRDKDIPLIGFCGAPLTTLCYMLQGASNKHDFPDAKKFFYNHKKETEILIEQLTDFMIDYAIELTKHGIDAFQLFDTHAGILPSEVYSKIFLPSIKRIATALRSAQVPFIFFPKGLGLGLDLITPDVCDFVSIDWQTSLHKARLLVHHDVGLQGNIDPYLLFATKDQIVETMKTVYVPFFKSYDKWIMNLGHGVLADTPFDNLCFLTDWIKDINNWK